MSELHKKLILSKLPPPPPPGIGGNKERGGGGGAGGGFGMRKRDYSPLCWKKYFDQRNMVKVDEKNIFCTYEKGIEGPLVVCLHGGGFSGLSWALFAVDLHDRVHCQCLAMDLRGHGETVTADDTDLCADRLANDVCQVIASRYGDEQPPIILIGHSMGGAVAIRIASADLLPSLVALVVIDVVEGSAMEALCGMKTFLRSRPAKFTSLENAIEWSVRSGQLRNVESARISMAGQIKRIDSTFAVSAELDAAAQPEIAAGLSSPPPLPQAFAEGIAEEEECDESMSGAVAECDPHQRPEDKSAPAALRRPPRLRAAPAAAAVLSPASAAAAVANVAGCKAVVPGHFVWRIRLEDTERFWEGWFKGMSQAFLSVSVPKLLLLAGTDRLDKDLTIGQMQGKFQMQVLPRVGHAVHEDSPDKVADALASFMVRYRFAETKEDFDANAGRPGC